MRRRKRGRSQSEVELNLAAMLDMAFQLLTFFILTYQAPPTEGQISLRLPPPEGVVNQKGQAVGSDTNNQNPLKGLKTLTITVMADPRTGEMSGLGIGEQGQTPIRNVLELDRELRKDLASVPFDQVIIQVSPVCRYDALMKVIDVCTRQTLADGKKLSKLSFVDLPGT
jgi:biopolymer transport protein ExbD